LTEHYTSQPSKKSHVASPFSPASHVYPIDVKKREPALPWKAVGGEKVQCREVCVVQ